MDNGSGEGRCHCSELLHPPTKVKPGSQKRIEIRSAPTACFLFFNFSRTGDSIVSPRSVFSLRPHPKEAQACGT